MHLPGEIGGGPQIPPLQTGLPEQLLQSVSVVQVVHDAGGVTGVAPHVPLLHEVCPVGQEEQSELVVQTVHFAGGIGGKEVGGEEVGGVVGVVVGGVVVGGTELLVGLVRMYAPPMAPMPAKAKRPYVAFLDNFGLSFFLIAA